MKPSEGGVSGAGGVNGEPDPRLAPTIRVMIEVRGNKLGIQGNAPWSVMATVLKDAIVALAQQAVREESKTLVKPASEVPPPLRRLP